MSFDGSISAEHGVGRLKRDELERIRPKAATEMMRAIKHALDPNKIMNLIGFPVAFPPDRCSVHRPMRET